MHLFQMIYHPKIFHFYCFVLGWLKIHFTKGPLKYYMMVMRIFGARPNYNIFIYSGDFYGYFTLLMLDKMRVRLISLFNVDFHKT